MPTAKVADTFCQYLCKGNFMEYCGGDGAYMSLFVDKRRYNPGDTSSSSIISSTTLAISSSVTGNTTSSVTITSSSTTSSTTAVPTGGYQYLGCANEGTNGRALAKDATASATLTVESCQQYCTSKGYPLSGMEYSTECYCGSTLENGATVGGSTQCTMPCGGNANQICGGPGALSVYNNTLLLPPKTPVIIPSVDNYGSQGCYTEGVGERALAGSTTANSGMTVAMCVSFCKGLGFKYAGIEYSTECYCGATIAATAAKASDAECNMLCGGDAYAYCGGPGRLNVYAAAASNSTSSSVSSSTMTITSSSVISNISVTITSSVSSSTSSSVISTPTDRPNFTYLGCANEGTTGRALAKDSFANSTMTLEKCQDYCTTKGYPLSGVEYSTECFCGNVLENGSTIGGSTACTMPCGGNPAAICGGPGALSIYNNTAIVPPKQPATVPSVDNYATQGCYTEGVSERALAGSTTAASGMTVAICVNFCKAGGFKYAGVEYSTECYCGATIAATAAKAPDADCSMLCGGDRFAYCGGPGRLNVYGATSNGTTSSSGSTSSTSVSATSSITSVSSSITVISLTSTTSSVVVTPTLRPEFKYVGCANEGSTGRALAKDAYANSTMTTEICQDYCTGKGYPLSGVEYSTECFCGNVLENGSTIGGSTACTMPCGGNANQLCGGLGALSIYNNTAILPPKQPVVVPSVDNYISQGCYT